MELFFQKYSSFNYRPSTDWRQLGPFNALAAHCRWSEQERKTRFQLLKRSWTQVVESEFSGSSISHYQSLCRDLDISPVPGTVAECKSELKGVFVNIVDLVQYRRDRQIGLRGNEPTKFDSLEELREYSEDSGKYYPRKNAKAQMLRELLKELT